MFVRTEALLGKFGALLVQKWKAKMVQYNATMRTSDSLHYTTSGTTLSFHGAMANSWTGEPSPFTTIQMLDTGRKASPGRKPSTRYIEGYLKARGIQPRDSKGRFIDSTDKNIKRASFAIAKWMEHNDTKPTGLLDFVFNEVKPQLDNELAEALGRDIEDNINKNIKNVKK